MFRRTHEHRRYCYSRRPGITARVGFCGSCRTWKEATSPRFGPRELQTAEPSLRCWSPAANVGTAAVAGPAVVDVKGLYCPTRRTGLRPGIDINNSGYATAVTGCLTWVPSSVCTGAWASGPPGGGTDYGGCYGRPPAFDTSTANYRVVASNWRRWRIRRPGSEQHCVLLWMDLRWIN